jgi:hypothetical protein
MSYHKVNYKADGRDMTEYFPAYEVTTLSYDNLSAGKEVTVNLTKNRYGTTNYATFIQTYFVSSTSYNVFNLSGYVQTFSIKKKTGNSYNIYIGSSLSTEIVLKHELHCVTFYNYETSQQVSESINPYSNYKINNTVFNPFKYFPQYIINKNGPTRSSGSFYFSNTYGDVKKPLNTTYFIMGSVENESASSANKLGVKQIIYYENPKSVISSPIYISNNTDVTITVNTITLCFPSSPIYGLVSNYNVDGTPLERTFPVCETFQVGVYDGNSTISGSLTLLHNTRGTINYVVLSSYYYVDDGTTDIYNQYEASDFVSQLVIYGKLATSFLYATTKTTGDKWHGGIRFLVIYY